MKTPDTCTLTVVRLHVEFFFCLSLLCITRGLLQSCQKEDEEKPSWEEKALELLQAMGRLNSSRRHGKRPANAAASTTEGEHEDGTGHTAAAAVAAAAASEPVNPNTAQSSDIARSTGVCFGRRWGGEEGEEA